MLKRLLGISFATVFLVIIFFLGFTPPRASATPEFAKKEGRNCKTCHTMNPPPKKGEPNLNEVGRCYKEKKTLKECENK